MRPSAVAQPGRAPPSYVGRRREEGDYGGPRRRAVRQRRGAQQHADASWPRRRRRARFAAAFFERHRRARRLGSLGSLGSLGNAQAEPPSVANKNKTRSVSRTTPCAASRGRRARRRSSARAAVAATSPVRRGRGVVDAAAAEENARARGQELGRRARPFRRRAQRSPIGRRTAAAHRARRARATAPPPRLQRSTPPPRWTPQASACDLDRRAFAASVCTGGSNKAPTPATVMGFGEMGSVRAATGAAHRGAASTWPSSLLDLVNHATSPPGWRTSDRRRRGWRSAARRRARAPPSRLKDWRAGSSPRPARSPRGAGLGMDTAIQRRRIRPSCAPAAGDADGPSSRRAAELRAGDRWSELLRRRGALLMVPLTEAQPRINIAAIEAAVLRPAAGSIRVLGAQSRRLCPRQRVRPTFRMSPGRLPGPPNPCTRGCRRAPRRALFWPRRRVRRLDAIYFVSTSSSLASIFCGIVGEFDAANRDAVGGRQPLQKNDESPRTLRSPPRRGTGRAAVDALAELVGVPRRRLTRVMNCLEAVGVTGASARATTPTARRGRASRRASKAPPG